MALFVDPDFPASDAVLYDKKYKSNWKKAPNYEEGVRWLRLHELVREGEQPVVYDGDTDVKQGALGDCWFLCGLSVIARRKMVVANLFRNSPTGLKYNPEGKYVISFYYNQRGAN